MTHEEPSQDRRHANRLHGPKGTDRLGESLGVHGMARGKEREEKVISLLQRVGLRPDVRNRYPHEFSGGQRQRISIARALALEPEFIVCDESVSALDVSVQAQVINLLMDLQLEFGFTYIFISHDPSVVKFISDTMAVMQKGKIVEYGAAEAIYVNPKEDHTRRFVEAAPNDSLDSTRHRQRAPRQDGAGRRAPRRD